jgi:hemolysin III
MTTLILKLYDVSFWRRTRSAQIHALALLLAIILGMRLFLETYRYESNGWLIFAPYIIISPLLFGVSAVYHFWHDGIGMPPRWANYFEKLDHITIYSFIASCYTVLLHFTLDATWGNRLIWASWTYAIAGSLYTISHAYLPRILQHRYVYTASFVLLGWIVMIKISQVIDRLTFRETLYFLAGGLAYTFGAIIYALRLNFFGRSSFGYHEIWHLLVVMGWMLHHLMIVSLMQ